MAIETHVFWLKERAAVTPRSLFIVCPHHHHHHPGCSRETHFLGESSDMFSFNKKETVIYLGDVEEGRGREWGVTDFNRSLACTCV